MENIEQNNGQPVAEGQEMKQGKGKKVWKTALALVVAAAVFVGGILLYDKMRWYNYEKVSENVTIQTRDLPDEYRVVNTKTGKVTEQHIKSVSWDDELPLLRFCGGKGKVNIGYFDRKTGETVIPPGYDQGWDVSEGIVAVKGYDKMLHFFTVDRKPLHTKTFLHNGQMGEVQYHGGHCAICDTSGLWGLIDTLGEWVIAPRYTSISAETDGWDEEWLGVWRLEHPGGKSIADSNARIILTVGDDSGLSIDSEGTIIVTHKETPSEAYDMTGKLLYKKAYYTVQQLFFEFEEDDEFNSSAQGPAANALKYILWDGCCGLMDLNGHPLTEALYSEIRMLGLNLFSATIYGSSAEVVLDSRGRVVE